MNSDTTKNRIIQKGAELVYLKGFNNTGIQEVLQAAEVPRGSFYFYFKNKEEFGLCLVDYFSSFIVSIAQKQMQQGAADPVEGLKNFFNMYIGLMNKQNFTCGCPIGNIAQEMSDLSDSFRNRIAGFFDQAKSMIQACIMEAQKTGRVGPDKDPAELSDFIFNSWEGALIDMKVTKSSRPLDVFMNTVFGLLLK
ncbi:MAG TPA: TetR family transcriptional regulator C-terminal domain-containing protein [Spirochaetota bacterium]|nr:TetR family transcriptional regulator C-terminal domain-containing protein [Spirochaetota bacterium]HOD16390.1 TetR family transcriptional regulator C-terminal domain-containing protein [Spirochaetota bacterium]HPG49977.1 TetR family transcriptional regulator C-terminal domain-containing protein [Spirochaetota bacterium]HPN12846.1 TetR family transcriptional regulator C-terminal domain-containing protein [Spirochaetota bacterium]HQL81346.1 TetR family transcriptional regulator C-terminal dom